MFDQERHSLNGTKKETQRPSSEQDRIDAALQLMCRRLNKSMTAERINLWHEDLAFYPVAGIEYVLDAWGRNARALPVLADLTGMLRTWMIPGPQKESQPGCERCEFGFIVTNPEASKADWIMTRCACIADPSLRQPRKGTPLSPQEKVDLSQRIKNFFATEEKRFPNGNPRLNIPLTQARVLRGL
jgi:hypothetical protein